jgi:dGTPase
LAQIAIDLLFQSPEVQQLEYKAQKMLQALFEALMQEYVVSKKSKWRLLKRDIEKSFERAHGERGKARLLCDYISGMSDEYAVRTYQRLLDPEFGSIADLV